MSIKETIYTIYFKVLHQIQQINSINNSALVVHQETFLPYKNFMNGKSIVMCGAGETLQKYRPLEGAVHLALNRAFLYDKVKFDFIFSQDFDGIRMIQQELVDYEPNKCVKFLGHRYGTAKQIPESLAIKCNAKRFYTDVFATNSGFNSKFVYDIDTRPIGGMPNVGISAMQFVLYMNPSIIYIVGCDMSDGHFTNKNLTATEIKNQEKELRDTWKKDYGRLLNKWRELKHFAEEYYPDTRIITVNPIGLRGIFEDFYQDER